MLNTLNSEVTTAAHPPITDPEPRESTASAPALSPFRRFRVHTGVCIGVSAALLVLAGLMSNTGLPGPFAGIVGCAGAALLLFSILRAPYRVVVGIVDLLRPRTASTDTAGTVAAIVGNLLVTGFGMLLAYLSTVGFSRGRQLRRLGRVILPELRANPEWATSPMSFDGLGEVLPAVADQWRENGKTEHASVAAFARLTLDLVALGAPPALIASANQDALDEIAHAEVCFSLARAIDGKGVSPAPFPQAQRVATLPRSRTLAMAKLAVDSLIDGALHEGVSARIIAKLAPRCGAPSMAAALKKIAADEGRHAAHGWTVVQWCLDQGGAPVAHALLGALRALPKEMPSQLPAAATDGGWERWGIHGRELEAAEYAAGLAHVIDRVQAAVEKRSAKAA